MNDSDLEPTLASAPSDAPPLLIGRYHLLQKIGEGGMGEVWLAEQKEPVTRRVALKLVKAGVSSREVISRFESERQALALMDHPAVSRVLDAGSTAQGTPYFVMDYVAGVPITKYCDDHRLTTRERLELFIRVCEGVQHAHQKAIIHRDLKPSNILVMEVDGQPMPRIIDFGVAKALTGRLNANADLTRVGMLIGTPEYMSPEQAASSGEDIDTRSDVYSLGIVFYELLAGAPPLDLRGSSLPEFLRRLKEEEPAKPSTRVQRQDAAASTALAQKHRTEPQVLHRQLSGDLDCIALKALEKERSRRYSTPTEFAADIRRYLNHEAVLAVPPSIAYRTRKFAGRYRLALLTTAAFILVLIATTAVSVRQSLRANREAASAQALSNFLQHDVLAQANAETQAKSGVKLDPNLTVRAALDRAAAEIPGKFDRQPEVEASIRQTIGDTYLDLGQYAAARSHLQRAVDLYRRTLRTDDPKLLDAMNSLGLALEREGKPAEAEAVLSETLKAQRRALGSEHPDTLMTMTNLALNLHESGRYAEAEKLDTELLELKKRVRGPENIATLRSMNNLAGDYDAQGKFAQAAALQKEVAEIHRRVLGPDHPETLNSLNNLAVIYQEQGEYGRAEELMTEVYGNRQRTLGPEHAGTLRSMNTLAGLYADEGKFAEAETLGIKCLEIRRRVLGAENPGTLTSLTYLVDLYQKEGKYPQAENYAVQALAGRRHTLGSDNSLTMDAARDLALAYASQGNFAAAGPLARESEAWYRKQRPDGPERFQSESVLGSVLAGQKKYAESEPLLLDAYQGMDARKDRLSMADRLDIPRLSRRIGELYQAWGKPERATQWNQSHPSPAK